VLSLATLVLIFVPHCSYIFIGIVFCRKEREIDRERERKRKRKREREDTKIQWA
jgi:hypothetical protein